MGISSKIALAMSANGASFEEVHTSLEIIADEFAIGFFEWSVSQEALDLINDLVLVGEINKATTTKELLEIYKKQSYNNKRTIRNL